MAKKNEIAKISDIAKIAGVSRATVSRVLTKSKNVRKETALKVKRAMRELDYRPNVLARGLATGRLNIVAMLMSETEDPFWLQLVDRMDIELRERGYILSICYLGKTEKARIANFRLLQEYAFSGYLIGDIRSEEDFVEEVRRSRLPLVFFNRYVESLADFDAVVVDNYHGGYLVGKHLVDLGHRRMAMLTGPLQSSASRDRFTGFRDALAEAGIELRPDMVAEGDLGMLSGEAFAREFLPKQRKNCTAVFAGNDTMAIGILNYCRERGIRVPDDLSLVGFDDLPYAGSPLVDMTTVRQPYEKISAVTIQRIVARIKGDDAPGECQMLPPKLIPRTTSGPCL